MTTRAGWGAEMMPTDPAAGVAAVATPLPQMVKQTRDNLLELVR
jgi:hypothetical protein